MPASVGVSLKSTTCSHRNCVRHEDIGGRCSPSAFSGQWPAALYFLLTLRSTHDVIAVQRPDYGSALFGRGSPEEKIDAWSVTDVVEWLGDEGFLLEMAVAHDENINGQAMCDFDHTILIKLGFSAIAERDAILQKVEQLQRKSASGVPSEWEPLKTIRHPELVGTVLTSIAMHPNDKSVLVHARDNVAR